MRKLRRNKRGLSPIISTLLMIMIVMVGMSIVFSAVVFYADSYQAGIGSSVLESLTIEDIWLQGNANTGYSNQVTLWVYNSGQIASTINAVYINGIAATNGTSTFNYNIPIQVGQHIPITVQACQSSLNGFSGWNTGTSYTFRITTLRGASFEQTTTAS
jgi:flagellin-like protein